MLRNEEGKAAADDPARGNDNVETYPAKTPLIHDPSVAVENSGDVEARNSFKVNDKEVLEVELGEEEEEDDEEEGEGVNLNMDIADISNIMHMFEVVDGDDGDD